MTQQIYRKEALSRLASPEQLDQLMPLTSPRGWVALAAAAGLLVLGLAWAVFGSLYVRVEGQGILLRPGGVRQLEAPANAQVARVAIIVGDEVQAGQELIHLGQRFGEDVVPQPIVAPFSGRVLDVYAYEGDLVEKGNALLSLEAVEQPLQAILYLPSAAGYQVKAGMEAQIMPQTSRDGPALRGKVKSAARFPATRAAMLRMLLNEEWVTQLTRSGPCLEVIVELGKGPGQADAVREIFSGTPCSAHITVGAHRPISLLLPTGPGGP